tara:strand:- start:179 stop:1006 length:828 start_codon:yes stop_codon:yes gene_type:complete
VSEKLRVLIQNKSVSQIDDLTSEQRRLNRERVIFIVRNKFRKVSGKRFLGPLWLILDPLIYSLIYLFVFTVVRAKIEASSIFIGVTLYRVLQSSLMSGTRSLSDSNGGLRCERVNSSVMLQANIGHLFLDIVLQTLPTAIILILGLDVLLVGGLIYLIAAQLMGLLFFGLGMSVSGLVSKIPDLQIMLRYGLMVGFYTSPAMIPMYKMAGLHYSANEYNPFSYFAEFVRYYCQLDSVFLELNSGVFAFFLSSLALLTINGFRKYDTLRWRVSAWS